MVKLNQFFFFFKQKTAYEIIGAAMEVHNELGCGFSEPVYQEALELEFLHRGIPHEREKQLPIYYKGILLDKKYISDFTCYNQIVVELKALSNLSSEHEAQVLNYLKATGFRLGLLINFGGKSLEYKRLLL